MPIAWLTREARYVEKLATPDVTIADMVGDIDPIKAAQAGINLSDELTMHYGLLPRANRGIFAINELPDLAGKIQVGLFNILQEGDVQIKGYPIRLKLDVLLVFTANPEDYTARGKIITPLKDRIGSEIRTHYPVTRHNAIAITRQEAWTERAGAPAAGQIPGLRPRGRRGSGVPGARRSQDRQAIRRQPAPADHHARARRLERGTPRARQRRERWSCRASPISTPRCRRSPASSSSSTKASCAGAEQVARDLIRSAVGNVFVGMFDGVDTRTVVEWFDLGGTLPLADNTLGERFDRDDARRAGAASSSPAHAGVAPGSDPALARVGDRLRARGPLRAEEDQPQRRARLLRRRNGGAAADAARGAGDQRGSPDPDREEEVLQLGTGARDWGWDQELDQS